MDALRPLVSRVAAAIVAALLTYLSGKLGVEVTDSLRTTLESAVTLLGMGLFTIVYAVVHRLIDRKVNPGDLAKPHAEIVVTGGFNADAGTRP